MKKMISLAVYIIKNYNERISSEKCECPELTDIRLQNLVYLCDKCYEKKYNTRLIEENFRLTTEGPVIHDLYYIGYPSSGEYTTFYRYGDVKLETNEQNVIDEVLNKTYGVSTTELIKKANKEFNIKNNKNFSQEF